MHTSRPRRVRSLLATATLLALVLSILPNGPAQAAPSSGARNGTAAAAPQGRSPDAPTTPGQPLTGPASGDPLDIALAYVRQHALALGLSSADLSDIVVKDRYVSDHNGVTHLYLRQRLGGIEVFNGDINVNVARDGSILNIGSRFVPNLQRVANARAPKISSTDAVQRAAAHLGLAASSAVTTISPGKGADSGAQLSSPAASQDPISVKLVYQPVPGGRARLAWDMVLRPPQSDDWWSLRADAESGAVLSQINWAEDEYAHATMQAASASGPLLLLAGAPAADPAPGSYNVYPLPGRSPADTPRTMLSNPADALASPYGWHDVDGAPGAEYTITRGNNVHAYEDSGQLNESAGNEPDGGPALSFSPALDLSQLPSTYTDAAVVHLFYANNRLHDILYHYGFDEAAGNFQQANYGGQGQGNDYVRAEAQDGRGTVNANFATPPDGQLPRMQMYVGAHSGALTVNAPAGIAGAYAFGTGSFGPTQYDVTDDLVLVDDATSAPGGTPTDGCEPLVNAASVAGKIALVDRGLCTFVSKVMNAQSAGAVGVLIVNNVAGAAPGMGGSDPAITIPTLSLSQADGATIKGQLGAGVNVSMSGGLRDGTLDNEVIIHEYGHGLSNRLTGGPSNTSCLANAEQAGEGWSDFVSLALTAKASETRLSQRAVGNWMAGYGQDGPGIRKYPYTTDMAVNPETYDAIKAASGRPHDVGEVWAAMLWEVYWNLIDTYGFDPNIIGGSGGNNRAIQLVLDGMKLQPCSPSFTEARDAILAADQANHNGADACAIWEGFAKRGLGYSARANDSDSVTDGVQAFDLPPQCTLRAEPERLDLCLTTATSASYGLVAGPSLAGPVTLSVSGAPSGTTATFSPNPLPKSSNGTLTLADIGGLSPGGYTFNLQGNDGVNSYTRPITLTIADAPPSDVALTAPASDAADQPFRPTFAWSAATQGQRYKLELATDAAFADVAYATTLYGTSLSLPGSLQAGARYHWRVTAMNGCGSGAAQTGTFTVRAAPQVLLVDDDANDPYDAIAAYSAALTAIGVSFDVWDTLGSGANEPDSATLANYPAVIWAGGSLGAPSRSDATLSAYADKSRCVVMVSQEYMYNAGATPFVKDYLGATDYIDDANHSVVTGTGVFEGLGPYTLDYPDFPHSDALDSTVGAVPAFDGDMGTAALARDAGRYRTLFLAFPLEALPSDSAREEVLRRAVSWCTFQTNLGVQAVASPAGTLLPGQPVTYTLSLRNTGAAAASDVLITDTLPAALTDVSATSSSPTIAPVAGQAAVWRIASLAPGANGTITITGKVSPALSADLSDKQAFAISSPSYDVDAGNNRAELPFAVAVPRVRLGSAAISADEGDGSATIDVRLSAPNPYAPVRVAVVSSDGSATAGSDYSAISDTLTIAAGATSASVALPISDDTDVEGSEEARVALRSPSGAQLGAPDSAALTIVDDDEDAPGLSLSVGAISLREGETATYQIRLTSAPTADVVVTVAPTGPLAVSPSKLTFTPQNWSAPQTVTVSVSPAQRSARAVQTATLAHQVSSADAAYAGISAPSVSVTVTTADAPAQQYRVYLPLAQR